MFIVLALIGTEACLFLAKYPISEVSLILLIIGIEVSIFVPIVGIISLCKVFVIVGTKVCDCLAIIGILEFRIFVEGGIDFFFIFLDKDGTTEGIIFDLLETTDSMF